MDLWQSLRFGVKALQLNAMASAPIEKILDQQRTRLAKLVDHAKSHSRYLGEKYRDIDTNDFIIDDLPTSNKRELMEHFDDWLTVDGVDRQEVETFFADESNLGKLYRDKYVLSHTSGSEGQSLILVKDVSDFDLMFALQAGRGNCKSLTVGEVVNRFVEPVRLAAVTLKPGFYPSGSAFEYMPAGVRQFIDVQQFTFGDDNLAEKLQDFRPTHLVAYASILHELARLSERDELDLSDDLQQVVNISDRLLPEAREHNQKVFDAPLIDDYGMGECLFLTSGCRTTGGMHVNADWVIAEVVDEENRPIKVGEPGSKLLITNLSNYIQPFIRYEVTDIVVMSAVGCQCGSNMPLIERVEGRTSDVLHLNSHGESKKIHPASIEVIIGETNRVREFQIVQQAGDRLLVRIEPVGGDSVDTEKVRDRIAAHLSEAGVRGVQIDVETAERLVPEEAGKKFKRTVVIDNTTSEESAA